MKGVSLPPPSFTVLGCRRGAGLLRFRLPQPFLQGLGLAGVAWRRYQILWVWGLPGCQGFCFPCGLTVGRLLSPFVQYALRPCVGRRGARMGDRERREDDLPDAGTRAGHEARIAGRSDLRRLLGAHGRSEPDPRYPLRGRELQRLCGSVRRRQTVEGKQPRQTTAKKRDLKVGFPDEPPAQ